MGEASRDRRVPREGLGHARLAEGRHDHPLQTDEGGVGLGPEGEGGRHHREDVGEHRAEARGGVHEPAQHLVGALRVGEPEALEQLDRGRPVHAGAGRPRSGEGLQEGSVEEALVQAADDAGHPLVLGRQGVGIGQAHRARDAGPRLTGLRQLVDPQVAHHLEPMLQGAEEPVGLGEGRRVLLGHVPVGGEGGERPERVRLPQPLVPAAVHDLQELDGELHVPDPAPTPLDLGALATPGPDVLLQAHLRPTHLLDRGGGQVLRVDDGDDGLEERRAELRIPGDRPGPDQRLALPDRGLLGVVGPHRLQRATERAAAAAGAERGIHPERDALGRGLGEEPDELRGPSLRLLLALRPAPRVDEEEVHVARVVELGAPQLPQGHDGHPVGRDRAARERDAGLGDGGDLRHHLLERGPAQVPSRHPEHRPAPEPPETVGEAEPSSVLGELLGELLPRAGAQVRQGLQLLGVPDEQVRRGRRQAEHPHRGHQHLLALQDRPGPAILPHPRERHPRELGIRGERERAAEGLRAQHPPLLTAVAGAGARGA
ncbi:hypothetical protein HRbin12_01234 [bacterium HR12]|nr:hypothetical protein HRbin12_01234 [bacterium HR12]